MVRNFKKRLVVLVLLLIGAVALALTKGAVSIPLENLFLRENQVILNMRILRIITAMLAGSGLAVSGIVLQAILRNPLAEPYLLGTSSGAGLGAVIAVVLGISSVYMPLAAFLGGVISIALVYSLASERGRIEDKSLILSGVIVSIAFSAVIIFLVSISGEKALHEISWWLWGSMEVYDYRLVFLVLLPVLLGITVIYFFSQDLNAIMAGEEEAMHLGIDAQKVRKVLILITALITASLVCICGIIGFVGLIVPHIMRRVVGLNHKMLIPFTCLAASAFMVVCDLLSRSLFAPIEIPIGVITAMIGAPVFIFLSKRNKGL